MRRRILGGLASGVLAAAMMLACSGGAKGPGPTPPRTSPTPPVMGPDAGSSDGGSKPDSGAPDAGGFDGGTVILPTAAGWTFYGPAQGGPSTVYGVSADEGGNLWVAGGEDGLFLLPRGSNAFERFTLADGLHPYGYLPDGTDAPGPHYLNVVAVSGGPAGTVFVGYQGRTTDGSTYQCEGNWDTADPDPSIYKSGDADRVTLTGSGISVVHYDIFSGPGMVSAEPRGRERLCNIWRVRYDGRTGSVWFGGNHGFAWGDPGFPGIQATGCTGARYGNYSCSGVLEHAHPAFAGYIWCSAGVLCPGEATITDAYYGIASVGNGDMWIGGANRSLHYDFGVRAGNFWSYEATQFDLSQQIDIWPDAAKADTTPPQRKDDAVSAIAAAPDGTAWVSSFAWGVAHLGAGGQVLGYLTDQDGLVATESTAIATDPEDGSIWIGGAWGGLTRLQGGRLLQYGGQVFGDELTAGEVSDIQVDTSGGARRILVAFHGGGGHSGAIGVYTGN